MKRKEEDTLVYETSRGNTFTVKGHHIKTDEHFVYFEDRYEGLKKIPLARVIEIRKTRGQDND